MNRTWLSSTWLAVLDVMEVDEVALGEVEGTAGTVKVPASISARTC